MDSVTSKISVDLLLQFESIARLGSLKDAASELAISPSAVSQSLRQLEDKLGLSLCSRSKGHFTLTDQGLRLLESAQKIKSEISSLSENLFSSDPADYDGILSMGTVDNFSHKKFPTMLSTMRNRFPKMKLAIQVMDPDMMISWVKSGDLDIAFGIFHDHHPGLAYLEIDREELKYFVSSKHPLNRKKKILVSDLYGADLTWFDTKLRSRSELKSDIFAKGKRFKMRLSAYTNNLASARSILDSGFAVVPLNSNEKSKQRRDSGIGVRAPAIITYCVHNPKMTKSPAADFVLRYFS